MPQTSNTEPGSIRAGDSLQFDRTFTDYPATAGWSLSYVLRGPVTLLIDSTPSGDSFQIRVPASTTETYPPGEYRLVGRISKAADRFTVHESVIAVEPDPATSDDSFAERMVRKLEAELEAISEASAANPVRSWTQGGRSEEQAPLDRSYLMTQLGYWREQVRVERGGPLFVPVRSHFVRP